MPRSNRTDWDAETDVLVVGSGGCGLVAAVTAAQYDVRVTLLEKMDKLGGTTAKSGGSVVAAGTTVQQEAGIRDSAESLAEDIMEHNRGEGNPELTRTITEEGRRTVDWFVDELGWEMVVNTGPYGRVGHQQYRRHWLLDENGDIERNGQALVDRLADEAEARGVEILSNSPVTDLVTEDGRVAGVVAGKSHDERIRTGKVLLASGGFGGNPSMQREVWPHAPDLLYFGSEGNEGDGLGWGEKLNASIENMTAFLGFATISYPEGIFIPWALTKEGGFVVNRDGVRFGDARSSPYSAFAAKIVEQPGGRAYLVFDERAREVLAAAPDAADRMLKLFENDVFETGETIVQLADALDLDADSLAGTLRDLNRERVRKLNGPFYGTEIQPSILQTQGGLTIDEDGRVLTEDGDPIPNLFAGGGAAAGLSGTRPEGYLSGNGLLSALNIGRRMARTAAEELVSA